MMGTVMNDDDDGLPKLTDGTAEPGSKPDFQELEELDDPIGPDGRDRMEAVHDVPVKVRAILGRSRMAVAELLRLKTGMVIELDRRVGEPVDIFVNDRLIARGEVVMIDNSLGVTLTEIVQSEH